MNTPCRYLEITFRNGKPFAAYFYLARQPGDVSVRTQQPEPGLIVDFATDGRAIGIEITSPTSISPEAINRVLSGLHEPPASAEELHPLVAA
ncbi:MAG: DUF2283 domain-containing protein [Planctomycetes bacterium]|nr:DUF2283 domain-containing protein [Planctomycetota bacterium]